MDNITPELLRENCEEVRKNERIKATIKHIEEEMLKESLKGWYCYSYSLWKNMSEKDYSIIKEVVQHFVRKGFETEMILNDKGKNYLRISWNK